MVRARDGNGTLEGRAALARRVSEQKAPTALPNRPGRPQVAPTFHYPTQAAAGRPYTAPLFFIP